MEDPELYIRKSPFFKMDKVKAPVLIFHAPTTPMFRSAELVIFRALQITIRFR